MRKLPLGAVSISALMLAAAACGNSDNTYETAENDAVEEDADNTAYSGEDDQYAYADDQETGTQDQTDESWEEQRYDRSAEAVMSDTSDPTLRTATVTSRTRAEIETLATKAFDSADANDDGALDRDEYVELALASARDFDAFVTEPVNLMSVNPATDPETDMTADEINDDNDVASTGDATRTAETATPAANAGTATALDAEEEATIETAAAQTFQEAAGGDAELTAEELRAAFLARFEEADEDGDDELNTMELRTFAALTRGQDESATMDTEN